MGAEVEYVALRELQMAGCVECNACRRTGVCRVQDDFQGLFAQLLECDRLIYATPIFFMAVCSQAKVAIDRCQCLWSRKYVLKQPLLPDGPRDRRGMVIAVGGTKSQKMFECVRLTFKYYFDVLEMAPGAELFVNQVDAKGEVLQHPTAMADALRLGRELVAGPDPSSQGAAT